MTRTWLLTSTTYGNWLPGDARGFVSKFVNTKEERERWNIPHTPFSQDMPKLKEYAKSQMKTPPVLLTQVQANEFLLQVLETVQYHRWILIAAAIMANHFHLVLESPEAISHEKLLQVIKSYGSRRLNQQFGTQKWWTQGGSARALYTESAINSAAAYVWKQAQPLVIYPQHPPTNVGGSQVGGSQYTKSTCQFS